MSAVRSRQHPYCLLAQIAPGRFERTLLRRPPAKSAVFAGCASVAALTRGLRRRHLVEYLLPCDVRHSDARIMQTSHRNLVWVLVDHDQVGTHPDVDASHDIRQALLSRAIHGKQIERFWQRDGLCFAE